MSSRWAAWGLSVVVASLVVACGPSEEAVSEILVVIDADPSLRDRIDQLEIETQPSTQRLALDKRQKLPLSVSLVADGRTEHAINVRALMGEATLVERKAVLRFERGARLAWYVYFNALCEQQACGQGQTCDECGDCAPLAVPATSLLPLSSAHDDGLDHFDGPGHSCQELPVGDGDDSGPGDGDSDGDGDSGGGGPAGDGDGGGGTETDASAAGLSLSGPPAVAAAKGVPTRAQLTLRVPANTDLPVALALRSDAGTLYAADCSSPLPDLLSTQELAFCLQHTRPDSTRNQVVEVTASSGEARSSWQVDFRTPVKEVSAGSEFTCALLEDGNVQCWGLTNDQRVPVPQAHFRQLQGRPFELPVSGALDLDLGGTFGCASNASGLRCWGNNREGQLGRGGSGEPAGTWLAVSGMSGDIRRFSAGGGHACAIKAGKVYCWGQAGERQLGPGSSEDTGTPVAVTLPTGAAIDLAAGGAFTCAIVAAKADSPAGKVYCWGRGDEGALGRGSNASSQDPVQAVLMDDGSEVLASRIFAGVQNTCAIAEGRLWCWGADGSHATGTGSGVGLVKTPTQVSSLSGEVLDVSIGYDHACAIVEEEVGSSLERSLYCWGKTDAGAFANLMVEDWPGPGRVQEAPVNPERVVVLPDSGTCVIASGLLSCWGNNTRGQLGTHEGVNNTAIPTLATRVNAVGGLLDLSVGADYVTSSCMRTAEDVWCWGDGWYGELGQGLSGWGAVSATPVRVVGLPEGEIQQVEASGSFSCARVAGELYCWGSNGKDINSSQATKVLFGGDTRPVLQVDVGEYGHMCALLGDQAGSQLHCWNQEGAQPAVSFADDTITSFACSAYHTCAIVKGGVQCYGYNGQWQLGDGSATDQTTPVDVLSLAPGGSIQVSKLATRIARSCALTSTGDVWCWGEWQNPSRVFAHTGSDVAVDLRGEGENLCYLRSNGATRNQLFCDGNNQQFQLATSSSVNVSSSLAFVQIDPEAKYLKPPIGAFSAGGTGGRATICAQDQDGLKCWGSNALRQRGAGPDFSELRPQLVLGWMN
jgi:alpha-tubulin suppressor-like RCC1 family protein